MASLIFVFFVTAIAFVGLGLGIYAAVQLTGSSSGQTGGTVEVGDIVFTNKVQTITNKTAGGFIVTPGLSSPELLVTNSTSQTILDVDGTTGVRMDKLSVLGVSPLPTITTPSVNCTATLSARSTDMCGEVTIVAPGAATIGVTVTFGTPYTNQIVGVLISPVNLDTTTDHTERFTQMSAQALSVVGTGFNINGIVVTGAATQSFAYIVIGYKG